MSKGREGVVRVDLVAELLGETPTRTSALRALVPAAKSLKGLRLPPRTINKATIGADPLAEPVAWPSHPERAGVRSGSTSLFHGPDQHPSPEVPSTQMSHALTLKQGLMRLPVSASYGLKSTAMLVF
jgi:hypothetical protein